MTWLADVARDIEASLRDAVLRGELEAYFEYNQATGARSLLFRRPVLRVPRQRGTWTDCVFRACDAARNREPVDIPGREGLWRVVEVFSELEPALEWNGQRWVEGQESRTGSIIPDHIRVRVVPWTPAEPPPAPESTKPPVLAWSAFRLDVTIPAAEFEAPVPDLVGAMMSSAKADLARLDREREAAVVGAVQAASQPTGNPFSTAYGTYANAPGAGSRPLTMADLEAVSQKLRPVPFSEFTVSPDLEPVVRARCSQFLTGLFAAALHVDPSLPPRTWHPGPPKP